MLGSIPGARRAGRGRPVSILSGGGDELAAGAAPESARRLVRQPLRPGLECSRIHAGAMDRSRGKWFLRPEREALEIRGRVGLRRRGDGGRAWRALNTWTQVPSAVGVISCVTAPTSPPSRGLGLSPLFGWEIGVFAHPPS